MLHQSLSTSASSVRPSSSPRYLLDGAPVTLNELLAANDFAPQEVAEITALPPGSSMNLGGGAAPTFTLTRVADGANRTAVPDFRIWPNAQRFALIERLLKSLTDEPTCPTPVLEVARKLLGKIRFRGYEQALADDRVLAVDVEELAPAARWVLVVALAEWISEQWDEDSVELYDIEVCFEEVLHLMAAVNAASLLVQAGAK